MCHHVTGVMCKVASVNCYTIQTLIIWQKEDVKIWKRDHVLHIYVLHYAVSDWGGLFKWLQCFTGPGPHKISLSLSKQYLHFFFFFLLAFLVRLNSDCVGERKFKSVWRSFACGKPQLLLKPRHPKIKLFPRNGTESQPMSIIVSFFEAMSSLD